MDHTVNLRVGYNKSRYAGLRILANYLFKAVCPEIVRFIYWKV